MEFSQLHDSEMLKFCIWIAQEIEGTSQLFKVDFQKSRLRCMQFTSPS